MEFDDIEDIIQCCSICNYKYDPKSDKHRPHVLVCGHTFCGACLELDRSKCQTCGILHTKPAVINYQLEEQLKAINDYKEMNNPNFMRPLKNILLCLDCKIPMMKSDSENLDFLHQGHEILKCDPASEPQLKKVFWLLDIFNRGATARTKFEKVLQSILYVGEEYQRGLEIYLKEAQQPNFEERFALTLKNLVLRNSSRFGTEPEFVSHLKRMLTIESVLGPKIHKLAHKCSQLKRDCQFKPDPAAYEAMFVELGTDAKKGLHILPHKKQLNLLPELSLKVVSRHDLLDGDQPSWNRQNGEGPTFGRRHKQPADWQSEPGQEPFGGVNQLDDSGFGRHDRSLEELGEMF